MYAHSSDYQARPALELVQLVGLNNKHGIYPSISCTMVKTTLKTSYCGWLGSRVTKALDLQHAGCEFNSWPRRCRVTTINKLFTPTCLGRLQWFSDGMIDCGVRGRGQLCLSRQPLRCTALGMGCTPFLQCLGQLSLPPSVGR